MAVSGTPKGLAGHGSDAPQPGTGDRVGIGSHASVTLHRTLRVPEDDREYPLPPGLGHLPVYRVADWADRLPASWKRPGAVFVPLYQREATWLGFDGQWWRPNAVLVGCSGINVVTGRPWTGVLEDDPQNYLVIPDQPWLDGFRLEAQTVRQFVAAPLGLGATVGEQCAGADAAALRLRVFEPVPGRFPEAEPAERDLGLEGAAMAGMAMGFAAGGRIQQRLYRDEHGMASWRRDEWRDVSVFVLNSEEFERVTGSPPPATPVTAETYSAHGLPWFDLYDERKNTIAVPAWLDRIETLSAFDAAAATPSITIDPATVVPIDPLQSRSPSTTDVTMTDDVFAHCIDRVIPAHLQDEAKRAERTEQGTGPELALVRRKKWKNGRRLRIRFLDGDSAVHAKVERVAKGWEQHANIHLDFGNDPAADIRISFRQRGYWSALGTDALVEDYFPKNQPTMNFQGFSLATPDAEYHRVVLHEFGHALGCIHEHQNPANGIKWNKDQVYRDLSGPPNNWDRATIDHNMFAKYGKLHTNFSGFDPKSIMLYAFPSSWTLDGMTFPSNNGLSATDTSFIGQQYPK